MADTFGEYVFRVRSYECGVTGCVSLPSICNYLQEAASLNAAELGFSKSDFNAAGDDISWVLTRLRVKMTRYPHWNTKIKVFTYPRGGRKIVAWRDFILFDENDAVIGVATSEWMIINLATRKVTALPESVFAAANTVRAPVLGSEPFSKFKFPQSAENNPASIYPVLEFTAQNSQIDLNGHVNNVHYIEWMLEPILQKSAQTIINEMEVVFRSETFAGDKILVAAVDDAQGLRYHRVYSADGKDHITAITC